MMKFSEENVVQTEDGDLTIGIGCGECCRGRYKLSVYGNNPRTYNNISFSKEELKKLGDIIARITHE